ncbi:hypothetical protein QYE76_069958 [Lolium multiflorum]|uniref:Uncharacterized protein n=1 Tax=Lolium multiflorum TaxID=4521 RepID=A0AAD8SJ03_LOLMU|nr:hypothetical protein QYE76_069958 [Lolium multiflorum]
MGLRGRRLCKVFRIVAPGIINKVAWNIRNYRYVGDVSYRSKFKDKHGEDADPTTEEFDVEVAVLAGQGKKGGRLWIADGLVDPRTIPSLRQIRRGRTSEQPRVETRPRASDLAIEKLRAEMEERERRHQEEQMQMQQQLRENMQMQQQMLQQMQQQQQMFQQMFMNQAVVTSPPGSSAPSTSGPPMFPNYIPVPDPQVLALLQRAPSQSPLTPGLTVNNTGIIRSLQQFLGWKEDIYYDYRGMMTGTPFDASTIKWRLSSSATPMEFQIWESHIDGGFERCKAADSTFGGQIEFDIAYRRVDDIVASWYRNALIVKGIIGLRSSWADFKKFLRASFKFTIKPLVYSNTTVTKVEVKSSEERKPGSDTKSTTVTVEEDVPLSGLNMQLKKVQGDACKTVDKGQRWSLFQTQCIIKGKACKLMIDGGSCTNGISKAMVAALGLSTWRLPEPKRLEWLNSCGMLKITHKVRVPFTVDDYVDEIECDVLPLEVCGLLLGRPWQYDRNVTHAGRANTYSFMHGGKHRTLKPMGDDHIKSDVELVVRKEKLHKPKVQREVHVVPSIDVGDVSAMPVDDKPVLVGDKPDEPTLVVAGV